MDSMAHIRQGEEISKEDRRSIKPLRFSKCFPELNPADKCWNQGKGDPVGSSVLDGFKK